MYVRRCLSHQFRISFRRLRQSLEKLFTKNTTRCSVIATPPFTITISPLPFRFLSFLKQGILIFIWGWSLYSRWRHCLLHNCTIQLS
ncbi:hypothetical protein P8452_20743 [Trifolium repens]|nr:hypothetical protein P8452_20743 [Trifolium repens]